MAVITTSELLDKFFEGKDPEIVRRVRPQVDRPEMYAYELKIGKQLVDMNVDELFEMILTFNVDRRTKVQKADSIVYTSYPQIASAFRSLFNFYIDNYEVIRNPWNDKRMRGVNAANRLAESREPITWETVEDAIKKVRGAYDTDKANYIECVMLLFYNGFAKAEEIVSLTEDMINFKSKQIRLTGRTITLSDRCFELLTYVHGMSSLGAWRGQYTMLSYHGGYFKYPVRPNKEEEFNSRPPVEVASTINRRILVDVKGMFNIDINYKNLYLLGFYDSIVKTCGEDRARELVLSYRNSADTVELMKLAMNYGVDVDNITELKRLMRRFV